MQKTVAINCFFENSVPFESDYAVVVVDVIRATTSAITAVAMGRECFPVPSLESALRTAGKLRHPLLVGELAGEMPGSFDMNNSPAALAVMTDVSRPMVLLSSSGSRLMHVAAGYQHAYLGSFRNYFSLAKYLVGRHAKIAVIGAGSRGEFREEDQMCCAWIAEELIRAGYKAQDDRTKELVERWRGASPEACVHGHSAQYLKRSGQLNDLEFILEHVNDIDEIFVLREDRVVKIAADNHCTQNFEVRGAREALGVCRP